MTEHSHTAPNKRFNLRRNRLALAAAGLLVVGGAAGAVTVAARTSGRSRVVAVAPSDCVSPADEGARRGGRAGRRHGACFVVRAPCFTTTRGQ